MKHFALSALVSAVLATAATASDLPKEILDRGVLNLSVSGSYAPLEYVDPVSNQLVGLDIDLGNALGEVLGVKVEWTNTPFAQLITALSSGRTDFILSGMADRASRRETMDFVNYMSSGAQFLVSAKSDMTELMDLCGRKAGAARSTSYGEEIAKWSAKTCEPAGKPAVIFEPASSANDARSQLQQGRIDAVIQGGETLPFAMQQDPGVYKVLGEPITYGLQGIAFRKDDTQLRDAVTAALTTLMENGKYAEIFAKWDLSRHMLEKPTLNAGPQ